MRLKWEDYMTHQVAKVLVNSPSRQIEQKLYYLYNELMRKYSNDLSIVEGEYEELAKELFMSHVFDQQVSIEANWTTLMLSDDEVIPYQSRVNVAIFDRDNDAIEAIKKRVIECRKYLAANWYHDPV